ncbi:MAG TPA: hypothetical protein VF861_05480 [Telluria sp.]
MSLQLLTLPQLLLLTLLLSLRLLLRPLLTLLLSLRLLLRKPLRLPLASNFSFAEIERPAFGPVFLRLSVALDRRKKWPGRLRARPFLHGLS